MQQTVQGVNEHGAYSYLHDGHLPDLTAKGIAFFKKSILLTKETAYHSHAVSFIY
jgi:hypothetical protein